MEGVYVPLEDTISSFEEILAGNYDDLPEDAFRMVATVDDVKQKP